MSDSEKEKRCRSLAVVGSTQGPSSTGLVLREVSQMLEKAGWRTDLLDPSVETLPMFNVKTSYSWEGYAALRERVMAADVILLGTPDYHGCMSGVLKNFLDHFWKEYAGKLVVSVVASYEKGLTVTDQIRTFARQCYAWTLPYGMSLMEGRDVQENQTISAEFRQRLEMWVRDIRVYGPLLAVQKNKDLQGEEPGFLARYRK